MQPLSWVEVNLDSIRHNIAEIRGIVGDSCQIMAIVKADAYGHGARVVAKTVVEAGVERLGVVNLSEGVALREAGINCPILSLGPIEPEMAGEAICRHITPTIFSLESAMAFSKAAESPVRIHIKIDTGMGRLGVLYTEAFDFIKRVSSLPGIEIEGIFSHLASSDAANKAYSYEQFRRFQGIISHLREIGIVVPITHIANSGAIIDLPEMRLDMVRPGIAIYGLFPSKSVSQQPSLQPAMSFKTRIIHLKEMQKDLPVHGFLPVYRGISYGRTYVKKRLKVAVLPVGYADGYPRALSNKAEVLVSGQRAPIIGTVTMNFCMVDVSHIPDARVGDEVVLFGEQAKTGVRIQNSEFRIQESEVRSGDEIMLLGEQTGEGASRTERVVLSADELAEICGTISYEILCGVKPHIPRVYVNALR